MLSTEKPQLKKSSCRRKRYEKAMGLSTKDDDCLISAHVQAPYGSECETELVIEVPTAADKHNVVQRKLYGRGCRRYGVPPSSHYLRHTDDAILKMSNQGLGANGTKALCIPLQVNTMVTTLDLTGNFMGAAGARHLAFMLLENSSIVNLNISYNNLGSNGARVICQALANSKHIKQLDLSGNGFEDKDAKYFGALLEEKDIFLRDINLSDNKFSEEGAVILGNAIATNGTLDKVNLSWNHLRHKGAEAIAKCLQENNNVDDLNLSMNGLSRESAKLLGSALQTNTCLRILDVSHNRIDAEGCAALAEGLSKNETLATLKIGVNPITVAGSFALIQAIRNNESSAMECLDISDTVVSRGFMETAEKIAEDRSFSFVIGSVTNWPSQLEDDDEDPRDVLMEYLSANSIRLAEIFPCLDSENHDGFMSKEDFVAGIQGASVPLSDVQLDAIVDTLDIDENGRINITLLYE